MPRIVVANPADGGLFYWLLKLYLFGIIALGMLAVFVAGGVYVHFAKQLPPMPNLSTYAQVAPGVTTLLAQDGTLIGELATERREIIPLDRVPQALVDAFVATEDRRFFSHRGLDIRGTLRALRANLRAGQVTQGGSTITQQVAKAFLSSERTFSRKIKEAIFARRLEGRYRKRAIQSGRPLGWRDVEIVEIRESRAQEAERRNFQARAFQAMFKALFVTS